MSDFVEAIVSLFKSDKAPPHTVVPYPQTAQDGGKPQDTPNDDPEYFQSTYPGGLEGTGLGVLPHVSGPENQWLEGTLQGKFIPYIGNENHGVDVDVDLTYHPINDIDLIQANGVAFGTPVGDPHVAPVPVTIVDSGDLFGVEKRYSTNAFTLEENTPVQVAAKRLERSKIIVNVSTSGPVVIGPTLEQVVAGVGLIVASGQSIEFITNQPVWAITTVAGSVVSLLEEFTTVEGSKRL